MTHASGNGEPAGDGLDTGLGVGDGLALDRSVAHWARPGFAWSGSSAQGAGDCWSPPACGEFAPQAGESMRTATMRFAMRELVQSIRCSPGGLPNMAEA